MELTEKRIRECVRYCRDESSPGPYWIYDVKGVRGMYLYRSRGNVHLRQVCGAVDVTSILVVANVEVSA